MLHHNWVHQHRALLPLPQPRSRRPHFACRACMWELWSSGAQSASGTSPPLALCSCLHRECMWELWSSGALELRVPLGPTPSGAVLLSSPGLHVGALELWSSECLCDQPPTGAVLLSSPGVHVGTVELWSSECLCDQPPTGPVLLSSPGLHVGTVELWSSGAQSASVTSPHWPCSCPRMGVRPFRQHLLPELQLAHLRTRTRHTVCSQPCGMKVPCKHV
jgi:hypothetical protein